MHRRGEKFMQNIDGEKITGKGHGETKEQKITVELGLDVRTEERFFTLYRPWILSQI
jgi:hypothetical protein